MFCSRFFPDKVWLRIFDFRHPRDQTIILDPAVHGMGAPQGWLRRSNDHHGPTSTRAAVCQYRSRRVSVTSEQHRSDHSRNVFTGPNRRNRTSRDHSQAHPERWKRSGGGTNPTILPGSLANINQSVIGAAHGKIYYGLPGRSSKMPLRGD